MADEIKDILQDGQQDARPEDLLKYLNGELGQPEAHELEKQLVDDPFGNDAMDGLQEIKEKERILLIVDGLNRELRKKTARKRKRDNRHKLKAQWWLYFSILILLLIIVLLFFYIRHYL
ncbi:MAG: hypothetical protein QM727_04215 [Niabella sp.]